jgi:hypothetical protein
MKALKGRQKTAEKNAAAAPSGLWEFEIPTTWGLRPRLYSAAPFGAELREMAIAQTLDRQAGRSQLGEKTELIHDYPVF